MTDEKIKPSVTQQKAQRRAAKKRKPRAPKTYGSILTSMLRPYMAPKRD